MGTRTLELNSWIRFGKYTRNHKKVSELILTEDGRKWLNWLIGETEYEISKQVVEELKKIGHPICCIKQNFLLEQLMKSTEALELCIHLFEKDMALTTKYGITRQIVDNKEIIKKATE